MSTIAPIQPTSNYETTMAVAFASVSVSLFVLQIVRCIGCGDALNALGTVWVVCACSHQNCMVAAKLQQSCMQDSNVQSSNASASILHDTHCFAFDLHLIAPVNEQLDCRMA